MDGFDLFEKHSFTVEYQIDLIKNIGEIGFHQKIKMNLSYSDNPGKKCINECVEIVREKWITVCKNEGNLDVLRTGYNLKTVWKVSRKIP